MKRQDETEKIVGQIQERVKSVRDGILERNPDMAYYPAQFTAMYYAMADMQYEINVLLEKLNVTRIQTPAENSQK